MGIESIFLEDTTSIQNSLCRGIGSKMYEIVYNYEIINVNDVMKVNRIFVHTTVGST